MTGKLATKTTAAILIEQQKPLEIAEIDLPETLDVGQVLVEISYSGICGSQLGEIGGVKGPDRFLPHLLGHEGAGRVLATGPGVKTVVVGDLVVLHWCKGAGIESDPPSYQWNGAKVNAGWVTSFNRHGVISENRLTKIPDSADLQTSALFGCAVTTGFGVVVNDSRLQIGESVVVFGAGGIGLNMIKAAALTSAYPIIAVDLGDDKLALAEKMGATHLINSSKEDAGSKIWKILGSTPLDVFIDNTGNPKIIETGYELVSNQGRLVLVGVPAHDRKINIHSLPMHFGKTIKGSHGGDTDPEKDIPRYYSMHERGKLDLESLVDRIYPLEKINEALDDMRKGRVAGRVLIEM